MRASSTVPAGYLYCNGTTYNTTAYAGLWSVIFYTYGGSGSNFKVPDYRACFIRGFDSQTVSGTTYTAPALGTVQQDSVLSLSTISHQGYWSVDSGGGGVTRQVKARSIITGDPVDTTSGIAASFTRQNTTENRPINQSVYYYIKF
jgi:microcystin-dependent protein